MTESAKSHATGEFVSENLKLDGKFLKLAFDAPDLLGKVLRTHIEIEAQIDKLVSLHADVEFVDGTEFSTKCLILQVMGWPASQLKAIQRFGSLRNKFAHRKPEGKTELQIDSLRRLIIAEHGMQMVDDIDRFRFAIGNAESRLVGDMDADEKLVVVGAMLAFLLGAAADTHTFTKLAPKVRFEASQK